MPGPCSAPNGNFSLTTMCRAKNETVKSGKTAYKKGHIKHAKTEDEIRGTKRKQTRAQRQRQEES